MKEKKKRHVDFKFRFVTALEVDDPMMVCVLMREMLNEASKAFHVMSVTHEAWLQLDLVVQLLRQSFQGQDAPPLFDMYGKLGAHLCKIGYLETGAACIKLFTKYGYRPMADWPLAKARDHYGAKSIESLADGMEEIRTSAFDRTTLPEISPALLT